VTAQATADCPELNLSPAIDVTKSCSTTLAQVAPYLAVKVLVEGTVCNTGDAPLSNVAVTDPFIPGNLLGTAQNLAVGECKPYSASYFPSEALNRQNKLSTTPVPGLALFTDEVTASATSVLGFAVQPDKVSAECTLCPTCSPDACPGGICPASKGVTQSSVIKKATR
jgi:hypothetical protein